MAKDKKSFIAYCDWGETFEMLSDEEAGQLIKHIFAYVNDKNPKLENRLLDVAFKSIKLQLKRDLLKYEAIVERNKINGQKGGRPRKGAKKNPNNPVGFLETQNNPEKPKKADTDNDNDNDNDNDIITLKSESEKKADNWKNDFEVYKQSIREGIKETLNDKTWIKKQEEFNPNINIKKSIEKACVNFWATEEGWQHKKKRARSSKTSSINWKTTFGNAIAKKENKVYNDTKTYNNEETIILDL